jgi:hypothetical protein
MSRTKQTGGCERSHRRKGVVAVCAAVALVLGSGALSAASHRGPDVPPAVDPGTPTYAGLEQPVPAEPVAFDPTENVLEKIYKADRAAGGES